MKIEIGESLIASYLNHVKGCRIIQTNWRTSGKWEVSQNEKKSANEFFELVKTKNEFKSIFKENSFEQLIKQAEIDVLGIDNVESIVYGIDIAFHGAGLNYGSKEDTAQKILMKVIRTILIMQSYFNEFGHYFSIFVTPKTNPATYEIIDRFFKTLENITPDNVTIAFITNEKFSQEFVIPTIKASADENDTSELFLRAYKLLEISDIMKEFKIINPKTDNIMNTLSEKRTVRGMKIGQYVKNSMTKLWLGNFLTHEMILKLQNPSYCKFTFNAGFEVLRSSKLNRQDDNGMSRYYAKEIFKDFWLSSQWYERQWDDYLRWEDKIINK